MLKFSEKERGVIGGVFILYFAPFSALSKEALGLFFNSRWTVVTYRMIIFEEGKKLIAVLRVLKMKTFLVSVQFSCLFSQLLCLLQVGWKLTSFALVFKSIMP